MPNTSKLVDSIAQRLSVVMKQMETLKNDNNSLRENLHKTQEDLVHKGQLIKELRMKIEAAQTARSITEGHQAGTKARTQIDKLIGEIDVCLEYLSLSQ